jgi:tRNA A-37 threonylcarbamoyl transferase component Bud32
MGSPRGKLLGRYEIVAEVGRGAMGSVYKARDPKIDRFVAIKTVLLHQSVIHEQQEFRRRFFIEAQAAGRLLHPGIVAVFDVGEDPETSDPYIVMEYIEGQTLRELLASNNKKLPVNEALRITQELAEALDYAHAQGVVHRDIKPANILITKEGQAKISDFGIAQLDLTHMTLPGRVLGTPAYMSPEQLEGEQVDGRSDLFSLGAILYTALTGYRPFQGNSATTVCFKVANREPLQATSLAPELPQELDAVIARALAKDPTERYQRGKEFAEDLRKLRERRPARKATTLWFSPPAGGRAWIDGKAKREASSGVPAKVASNKAAPTQLVPAGNAQPPLRAAPRGRSGFGAVLSSWQAQTAIGIPLFVAAIVVSLFAWREMHVQNPARGNFDEAVDRAGVATSVQKQASGTGAADVAKSNGEVRGEGQSQDGRAEIASASISPLPSGEGGSASDIAKVLPPKKTRKPAGAGAAKGAATKLVVSKNAASAGPQSLASKTVGKPSTDATQLAVTPVATAVADSNVQIQIENRFSDAMLKIWIDDKLAYAHPLHDRKKRLLMLGGSNKETLTLPVCAGTHAVRVEVRSAGDQYDETKTVEGEFLSGGERNLAVSFDKHSKEMRMALANQ